MENGVLRMTLFLGILFIGVFIIGYFSFIFLIRTKSFSPDIKNITITDVYKNADEYGSEFCLEINDSSIRELCLRESITHKAKMERNPDICNELKNSNLSYECKRKTVFAAVAIKYREESNLTGNDSIIPSNIYLCDKLDSVRDRDYCKNPKKMVSDCGGVFCYT